MGQLHIKKIDLAEMIRRTAIIVIAEPDNPPTVTEQIVIKARGKKPPPYERHVQRYRVRETLRGNLAPGAAIAVISPDDALQERLHRDYHTKGLSRHVVANFYEPVAAPAADQPRFLFLNRSGERYAFTIAGGTEGLMHRSEIERLLSKPTVAYAPGTRETIVDRALRTHGDFGVYGDLRAGLAEISKHNTVKLTEAKGGYRVDIVPHDGQGHEYQFVVTLGGTIESFMAGESAAVAVPVPNPADFSRFMLRDVQGLHGGQNVYVAPDGTVHVQIVRAEESQPELQERRYRFVLNDTQRLELKQLLVQHPPSRIRIPHHPGIPDQARPEITVVDQDGAVITVAKWDDDRHPDFDALYDQLLRYAHTAQDKIAFWEGRYDRDWQPE